MKHKGFTLIELLVVISIIGLLASVVLVSINPSRAKARNTKRIGDIKQLVNAFNLGLNGTNSFPAAIPDACVSSSCYGGWSGYIANATVDAYLAPYISKPSDPTDSSRCCGGYTYINVWVGGSAPYDGYVFPAGAYLEYLIELPVSSTSCGVGRIWSVGPNYVQCQLKLD